MSDLIDRQAAMALEKDIIVPIKDGTAYKYRCIDPDAIKELPSAETETHYCRECKWSRCYINIDKHGETETYWRCLNWDGGTDEEGFCHEWERRTDETD